MRLDTLRDLCPAEVPAAKVGCRSFLAAAEALHHAAGDAELRELLSRTLLRMRGRIDVLGAILARHGAGRAEPGHGSFAALAREARVGAADTRFAAFEAHAERLQLGRDIDCFRTAAARARPSTRPCGGRT